MSTGKLQKHSNLGNNSSQMEQNLLWAIDGLKRKMSGCDRGGWMGTYSDHYPFILARCFLWCGVVGLWLVMDVLRLPKWIESLVIWTFCLPLPFSVSGPSVVIVMELCSGAQCREFLSAQRYLFCMGSKSSYHPLHHVYVCLVQNIPRWS